MASSNSTRKPASRRAKLLSSTRPRVPSSIAKPPPSLNKSKSTRTIIRTHHTLHKQLASAKASGDAVAIARLEKEIEENGGLDVYQRASLMGQKRDRGGDSSKELVKWLFDREKGQLRGFDRSQSKLKLLEVGALDPDNAITRVGCVVPTRIDLHSQHKSIITQDFMKRPVPASDADRFDIISLSLVLNYVPDSKTRGLMLRRCAEFLSMSSSPEAAGLETNAKRESDAWNPSPLPLLFLVLPRPCVDNSRYLTWDHLSAIMTFLGFVSLEHKLTNKLSYSLWRLHSPADWRKAPPGDNPFKKKEINPGKSRNNFCIVLE